jgi:hypothetical protein
MRKKVSYNQGQVLIQIVVFSTIAALMVGALIGWAGVNIKASRQSVDRERAIQLAEAGIDYYRWHLAHNRSDFKDGTNNSGPHVHSVKDTDGKVAGQFSLVITPPTIGSTLVKIQSTGTSSSSPTISRTIAESLAIPSFAKYAVVANDNMRFGAGTEVFGPIHSNKGIRFDGLAHNVITSALSTYDDPDHTGAVEFGVHTHVLAPPSSGTSDTFRASEAPPSAVPTRVDVFEIGRQFPVPASDFVGLTTNLAQIKTDAQSAGKYFASSGSQGYQITLKTNGTFDIYKVTQQTTLPSGCSNVAGQTGWGSWGVRTKTLVGNYAIPANGLIFVEDNIWVEGQINGSRVTIAAGRFPDSPATRPSITVNNNLLYTSYSGLDVISLISQGDINAGMASADTLRIDAALVAQNGRVGRYYYSSSCSPYNVRASLTLYGMIATNIRYGFAYTDGTGYTTRNIIYDANLLYGPPPSFPLTTDQYETVSWEEVH